MQKLAAETTLTRCPQAERDAPMIRRLLSAGTLPPDAGTVRVLVPCWSADVSFDRSGTGESVALDARVRACESVRAVLSDDHNHELGVAAARDVATATLEESGVAGLVGMTVELSLQLASALERIAVDQGLAAVDLAEVWFVD
jgi:hypothetical protein